MQIFLFRRNNGNGGGNYLNDTRRERSNSFTVNNCNFNQYGILEPNSQNQPRRRRRDSAPQGMNGNDTNNHHQRGRKSVIYEKINTLFNLKKTDISIQDIMKTVTFNASIDEIKNYLWTLQNEGQIYSTYDEDHWRPVHG